MGSVSWDRPSATSTPAGDERVPLAPDVGAAGRSVNDVRWTCSPEFCVIRTVLGNLRHDLVSSLLTILKGDLSGSPLVLRLRAARRTRPSFWRSRAMGNDSVSVAAHRSCLIAQAD